MVGDGLDDLLNGAHFNDEGGHNAGKSYLFFGSTVAAQLLADPTATTFDLSTADAMFMGENSWDYAGTSVSSAGDVDGDGFDDLLVGASFSSDGGFYAGKAYLLLSPY